MHAIPLREHWIGTESGWLRRFGGPRHSPHESVWLAGTAPGDGKLILNGEALIELAAGRSFEVEVTARMQPRNEVQLTVGPASAPTDVTVQIR